MSEQNDNFEEIYNHNINFKKIAEQIDIVAQEIGQKIKEVQEKLPDGETLEIMTISTFTREYKIDEIIKETGKSIKEIEADRAKIAEIDRYCDIFTGCILAELNSEYYNGVSFSQLLVDCTIDSSSFIGASIIPGSKLEKLIVAAEEKTKKVLNVPKIAAKIEKIKYKHPVGQINRNLWRFLEEETIEQIPGQESFYNIAPNADTAILINVNEEQAGLLFKGLTPFDKRVYFAITNLFLAGNEYMSTNLIYKQMGGLGRRTDKQKGDILKSVKKLMGTVVTIDTTAKLKEPMYLDEDGNIKEVEGVNQVEIKGLTENLLYAAFADNVIINGKATKDAIQVFKTPFLYEFAASRKEITTFDYRVLQIGLSNTDINLRIEDYLIEEIAQMKRKGSKKKRIMLLDSIYSACKITTKQERYKAKEKIEKCLKHFMSKEGTYFISGYDIDTKEGKVKIFLSDNDTR